MYAIRSYYVLALLLFLLFALLLALALALQLGVTLAFAFFALLGLSRGVALLLV